MPASIVDKLIEIQRGLIKELKVELMTELRQELTAYQKKGA